MTSRIGNRSQPARAGRTRVRGFTLIELILVMAVLASVALMSGPRLTGFMQGSGLRDDSRRVLSTMRHARNEAMSTGAPTEFWADPGAGTYGVRYLTTEEADAYRPVEFALGNGLAFEVEDQHVSEDGLVELIFWPDGSLDETSLDRMRIRRGDSEVLEIALRDSRLEYVIRKVDDANAHRTS